MDLRPFHPPKALTDEAARLLRYQPFILDDDRHTGVAYVWLYRPDPTAATPQDFFFDRRTTPEAVWTKAYAANIRVAAMYDAFVKRIVEICPKPGSYLDFGCNTGYFPVSASVAGVQTTMGVDLGDYSQHVRLLNDITGASTRFSVGAYDPSSHTISLQNDFGTEQYDVVSTNAVMCHLPDPLHFLKALARLASKAIFIWDSFVDSDELLIRYLPPNIFSDAEFPNGFDSCTSISLGLLKLSMDKLGFGRHEELEIHPEWMPEHWLRSSGHHAFLFWR